MADNSLMLEVSVVLLLVAALGGVVMAGMRFAGRPAPPNGLAMLHGMPAAAALTLLVYAWATIGLPPPASVGLILLVLTAAGGVVLNLGYHQRDKALPRRLVVVHAMGAVGGVVLLCVALLSAAPN